MFENGRFGEAKEKFKLANTPKTIAGFSVEKGEMEEEERGRGNDSLAVDLFP